MDGYQSIGAFDRSPSASTEARTNWNPHLKKAASAVVLAGCIWLRAADCARWTNVIASLGMGIAAQTGLELGHRGKTLCRIRQVVQTVCGQTLFFGLTQAYQNTQNINSQTYLIDVMMAQFGVNSAVAARWFYREGAIRVESHYSETTANNCLMQAPLVGYNRSHLFKVLAASGFGIASIFTLDPVFKGLFSYASSYFISQVVGERTIDRIDHQISEYDQIPTGTRWRTVKVALTTLTHVSQVLSFVPWSDPDSATRLRDLVFVGLTIGFSDGVTVRSGRRRMQRIPVQELEEFKELSPPTEENGCHRKLAKGAYKIFKYSVPLISLLSLSAFTFWQENWVLKGTRYPRIALGMMLTGFLTTYPLCKWIDAKWDAKKRSYHDEWMSNLWVSFRFFGIHPLFFYYAATNSLKMDSNAINAQTSSYRLALEFLAWAAYGISMGRELFITSSHRIKNAQLSFPKMVMMNAMTMMVLSLRKKIL